MNIVNIVLFVFAFFHGVSVVVSIPIYTPTTYSPQADALEDSFRRMTRAQAEYERVHKQHQAAVLGTHSAAWDLETAKRNSEEALRKHPSHLIWNFPFANKFAILGTSRNKKTMKDISRTQDAYQRAHHNFGMARNVEQSWEEKRRFHLRQAEEAHKNHANNMRRKPWQ